MAYSQRVSFNPYHFYFTTELFMETSGLLRHQLIESLTVPATEKAAATAIVLWERMATEIIAIVGSGGFDSLYARSIFLSQTLYPWLVCSQASVSAEQRFAAFKSSLEKQTPDVVIEANIRLLCTFTDILALLIGETLTTSILRSAWGDDARVPAAKGPKNE